MTVKEYERFVEATARPKKKQEHAYLVAYAALGLCGEAGETAELIKKSMRSDAPMLDKVKLALELGDPIWYAVQLALLHGMTFQDILDINVAKLRRRVTTGKDEDAEYAMAEAFLAGVKEGAARCKWCLATDAGLDDLGFCSAYCFTTAKEVGRP